MNNPNKDDVSAPDRLRLDDLFVTPTDLGVAFGHLKNGVVVSNVTNDLEAAQTLIMLAIQLLPDGPQRQALLDFWVLR